MSKNRFIVITGPTATGKTQVSVALAKALGSQVISADSMQLYRGMDIGTAKATRSEMDGVTHHFIDILTPGEEYSVAQFQQSAFKKIDELNAKGVAAVVAGGTGLYINSLVYKLDFSNSRKNDALRQKYNKLADDKSVEYLYNILSKKDPEYAAVISSTDLRRIVRRLEIIATAGVQPYDFRQPSEDYDIAIFGLTMPRELLYARVNERVDQMMQGGLMDEVKNVYQAFGNVAALKGIGYKELIGFFEDEYDLEEAVRLIKRNTRRFAKRQMTWFKKDERIHWLDVQSYANTEDITKVILGVLKRKGF